MLSVARAPVNLKEQLSIGVERLERVDEIDHLRASGGGQVTVTEVAAAEAATHLLPELLIVPIAVLVLTKVEEAHPRRAVERWSATPRTVRVDSLELRRRHRKASTAQW